VETSEGFIIVMRQWYIVW